MGDKSCFYYLVPTFLLVASACVAGWTAWVVQDDHSKDTFDAPNYLPAIVLGVGIMAAFVFLSTLFRLACCSTSGCCGTGLSVISFLVMIGFAIALFTQIGRLDKSERDYYRNELEHYYELGIGQCCYFAFYFLLAIFQGICRLGGCCSSCVKRDEYDTYEDSPFFV